MAFCRAFGPPGPGRMLGCRGNFGFRISGADVKGTTKLGGIFLGP